MHTLFPHLATTTLGRTILLSLAVLVTATTAPAKISFLHYLQETASLGDAESQFILGLAYRDGWDGNVKPGTVAARWCELAAELDDQRPEVVFGLLQKGQEPVAQDRAKALECLTLAAGQGNDYARIILGEMLLEGNGVPADWRTGTELIRKSAFAGFPPAQCQLGILYLIGDDALPKNEIEALAWFIVAAEAGSKQAKFFRDERTKLLGQEAAYLAVKRSRTLFVKNTPNTDKGG